MRDAPSSSFAPSKCTLLHLNQHIERNQMNYEDVFANLLVEVKRVSMAKNASVVSRLMQFSVFNDLLGTVFVFTYGCMCINRFSGRPVKV